MRQVAFAVAILVCVAAPPAVAQESQELPRGLFVSQWQCPFDQMQRIGQVYDSLWTPIEQALVNEGLLVGAGMFFHDWADEWNVNWYRLGQDRAAVFAAIEEGGRRFNQRHPNAPNMLASCTAHRDNIYFWGPRTSPPSQ